MTTDDDLLCALDQLTNTVYWCRQRGMPTTAGSAILEAVGDWLDSQDPTRDDDVPSVTADDALDADPLAVAFDRLGRHIRTHVLRTGPPERDGGVHRGAQPLDAPPRPQSTTAPPRSVRDTRQTP